jgi:hypothetical protein
MLFLFIANPPFGYDPDGERIQNAQPQYEQMEYQEMKR